MAEPEEVDALKRAYAAMILNTAKEAAARVMAAELRARRSGHDLVCTKDESARMLLIWKQMIDAKNKEVDITSMNQQKKIDVLESQLNEAEEIIIDLRAELNYAHGELDEVKLRQNESEIAEVHNTTLQDTNSGYGLFTALDRLEEPETICATETSLVQDRFLVRDELNPNTKSTDVEIVNGVGSSVLEERGRHGKNVSIIRSSRLGKRKLKFLDDVFNACGLDRSCTFKRLSCCNSSMSCEDRVEAEDGNQIKES